MVAVVVDSWRLVVERGKRVGESSRGRVLCPGFWFWFCVKGFVGWIHSRRTVEVIKGELNVDYALTEEG